MDGEQQAETNGGKMEWLLVRGSLTLGESPSMAMDGVGPDLPGTKSVGSCEVQLAPPCCFFQRP